MTTSMPCLLLALLLNLAFAGYNGAPRPHPFAACAGTARPAFPAAARCARSTQGQLRADAARVAAREQLAAAVREARVGIDEQLDLFIRSRERLLACLDHSTEDCEQRLDAVTELLTSQAGKLRKALAIAAAPPTAIEDRANDWVPNEVRLPRVLGGRALPPITAQEKKDVRELRSKLATYFDYRDPRGRPVSPRAFDKSCEPFADIDDPCPTYQRWLFEKKGELREAAAHIAEALVQQVPLVTQVERLPVTRDDARVILQRSLTVLKAWKGQVADDAENNPGSLVDRYMTFFEPVLAAHPEYCLAVEEELLSARNRDTLNKLGMIAGQAGTAFAGCFVLPALGCAALNAAWDLWDYHGNKKDLDQARARFSASGVAERGSATHFARNRTAIARLEPFSAVKNGDRDVLVSAAFVALGSLPVLKSSLPKSAFSMAKTSRRLLPTVKKMEGEGSREATWIAAREGSSSVGQNAEQQGLQEVLHVANDNAPTDDLDDLLLSVMRAGQ